MEWEQTYRGPVHPNDTDVNEQKAVCFTSNRGLFWLPVWPSILNLPLGWGRRASTYILEF